jgi:hypothetical protein
MNRYCGSIADKWENGKWKENQPRTSFMTSRCSFMTSFMNQLLWTHINLGETIFGMLEVLAGLPLFLQTARAEGAVHILLQRNLWNSHIYQFNYYEINLSRKVVEQNTRTRTEEQLWKATWRHRLVGGGCRRSALDAAPSRGGQGPSTRRPRVVVRGLRRDEPACIVNILSHVL